MIPPPDRPTGWLEISFRADPALHDALGSFLFDMGCNGLVTEDFQDTTLKAYLPLQHDLEEIQNRIHHYLGNLGAIFPDTPSPVFQFTRMADQDWGLTWRRFFKPARVTPSLLILPAWDPIPKEEGGHIIRMDPGPAFGTGQHPTTRMCLQAMEQCHLKRPWSLLDVGTGSGILAIYGTQLGAKKVVALDVDPEAIRWAERNIQLNKVTGSIRISQTPVENLQEAFALVCANLISGEILRLLPTFSRLVDPQGWLILSGILREQAKEISDALDRYDFRGHEFRCRDEWVCITTKRETP